MVGFINEMQDINSVLIIALLAIIALIIVCCVIKLFKVAVALLLFILIVPTLYNIFFCDGTEYVKDITSVLVPKYSQQIQDIYEQYINKRDENFVMSIEQDTSSEAVKILE